MHDPNLFSLAPKNNKHKNLRWKSIFNSFCPCFRFPVITPCFYNPVLFFSVIFIFLCLLFLMPELRDAASLCETEKGKREREINGGSSLPCAQGPPVSGWRQQLRSNLAESRRAPQRLAHPPQELTSTENFQTCMHSPHSTSMLKMSIHLYCLIRVSAIFSGLWI